jgi:hypothetical protein
MRVLPYERFTMKSPLSVDEVVHRLRNGVAPMTFSLRRPPQPFQGSVRGDTFVIHRVLGYRNSFRPEISGRIAPGRSGSAIEVTMTLHPVVAVFMGIWLTAAAAIFVAFGVAVLRRTTFAGEVGLFPFLFLPFGLALCTIGYRIEAGRSKQALYQLLGVVGD